MGVVGNTISIISYIIRINFKNTPPHTYITIYYTFLIISLHIDSTFLTYIATWFNCYLATKCTRDESAVTGHLDFFLGEWLKDWWFTADRVSIYGRCREIRLTIRIHPDLVSSGVSNWPKVVCQWELTQKAPWLGLQCPWPRRCNWFRSEMLRFENRATHNSNGEISSPVKWSKMI